MEKSDGGRWLQLLKNVLTDLKNSLKITASKKTNIHCSVSYINLIRHHPVRAAPSRNKSNRHLSAAPLVTCIMSNLATNNVSLRRRTWSLFDLKKEERMKGKRNRGKKR